MSSNINILKKEHTYIYIYTKNTHCQTADVQTCAWRQMTPHLLSDTRTKLEWDWLPNIEQLPDAGRPLATDTLDSALCLWVRNYPPRASPTPTPLGTLAGNVCQGRGIWWGEVSSKTEVQKPTIMLPLHDMISCGSQLRQHHTVIRDKWVGGYGFTVIRGATVFHRPQKYVFKIWIIALDAYRTPVTSCLLMHACDAQ